MSHLLSSFRRAFQSTLPLRGATIAAHGDAEIEVISIHAPLTGSDHRLRGSAAGVDISIHAPLTGSDFGIDSFLFSQVYFNPRSPYGERHTSSSRRLSGGDFNPRSPYGERPSGPSPSSRVSAFQSTLPLRGATCQGFPYAPRIAFQSTLPLRGATPGRVYLGRGRPISIHAPLTGSDAEFVMTFRFPDDFNPRSPYGERLPSW